jgi:hypothetical protein
VAALVVATIAVHLAQAGRIVVARIVGGVGLFVAADIAGIVAAAPTIVQEHVSIVSGPLWLPMSLGTSGYFAYGHTTAASDLASGLENISAKPLLLAAAFLVTYVVRRRTEPAHEARDVTVPIEPRGSWAPMPVRVFAVGSAVVGLGLWSFIVAFATSSWYDTIDTPIFLIEGRILDMAVMLFGLVIYNAGRGPVTAPAMVTAAVLFVVDHVIADHAWRGPIAAAVVLMTGAGMLVGASWLTPRLSGPGTTDTTARRALLVVAVTAAFAMPMDVRWAVAGFHAPQAYVDDAQLFTPVPSRPLFLLVAALGAFFLVTAVVAALTSRRERLSRPATAVIVLVAAGLFAAGTVDQSAAWLSYYPNSQFVVQPLIAVVILVAARWRAPAPILRSAAVIRAVTVIGAAGIAAWAASAVLLDPLDDIGGFLDGLYPQGLSEAGLTNPVPPLVIGIVCALAFARPPVVNNGLDRQADPM